MSTISDPDLYGVFPDRNLEVEAVGDRSIWVISSGKQQGSEAIERLNETTGRLEATIPLRNPAWDISFGDDSVWVVSFGFGHGYQLLEISTKSNQIVREVVVDPQKFTYLTGTVEAITVGNGDVYFAHQNGEIDKVSEASGKVLATWSSPTGVSLLQLAAGKLWLPAGNQLEALNTTTGAAEDWVDFPPGFDCRSLTALRNTIWASGATSIYRPSQAPGLIKVDAVTGKSVGMYPTPALAVTGAGAALWVAEMQPRPSLVEIDQGSGRVLRSLPIKSFGPNPYWLALRGDRDRLVLESGGPGSDLVLAGIGGRHG